MRFYKLLFIFLILSQTNYAQTADKLKQLKALEAACKNYADAENYKALLVSARQGFQLANLLHIDSGINHFSLYLANAYEVAMNNSDSVAYYDQIAEVIAFSMHTETDIVKAQMGLAEYFFETGKPDSVKVYREKMEDEVKIFKDSAAIISIYKELADVYSYNNENEKSLAAYMNVLHYYESHNDKRNTAVALVNIGNNYLQMSNSEKALPYFLRALPLLNDYDYGLIICAGNIGAAYANLKKYDSAIAYLKLVVRVAEKTKDTESVYATYEKMSAAYIGKEDYANAEKYAQPALEFYKQILTSSRGIIDGEERMGEIEVGRKNFKPAVNYFSDALQRSKKAAYPERIIELYIKIAEAADSAKLFEQATKYYSEYISFNDSITRQSSKKSIAELETQYQTGQKEQQINLLNQKEKTQELNLKTQRNTTIFLIAGIVFIAVLITVYIRYRNRFNQLKKLNEVRNNISRDLHDEIGATLSSINIYSEVAKNKLIANNDVQMLLQRINDGSLQMMESMSDIVWYVNPKNDVAKNTIIRMREYAAPVLEAKQIDLQFNADEKVNGLKLSMQQRQHLYLLFKEAINNVAKYAQAKNTVVNIKVINENVCLTIKDDGKGFDVNNHKQGNGLMNIKQRTELLKGKSSIKSAEKSGTIIEINFPVSL